MIDGHTLFQLDQLTKTYNSLKEENEKLKKQNEGLAHIVRRIYIENFPNTWFTCGELGAKDENGLPEMIQVCPAYGADWSMIYKKQERIIGGMGS